MFVLNLHFWKFGYGEGRRNWRFPVLEMKQDISFCHYLFIESNSTSGSYSSLEMDPQEALKNAGAEQATIVGGARTKPSNYVPSTKEGAAE